MDSLSPDGLTPLVSAAREDDVVAIAGLVRAGAAAALLAAGLARLHGCKATLSILAGLRPANAGG